MNTPIARWTIARWGPLAAALLLAVPNPGTAQDISQEWTGPSNLSLELARPFFDGGDFTAFSGLGYVSGIFGSGRTRFLFEVPFARGATDGEFGSSSSSMIGSPFVGVAWTNEEERRGVSGSLGARIPVPEDFVFGDDDFAPVFGVFGDPDRLEAFLTETATLSGALRYEHPFNERVFFRGQIDADVLFFIDSGESDAVEAFTGWGGLVRWDGDGAFVSGQVTGRFFLTDDGDGRVWHQLQGRGGLALGAVEPWIGFRVPIQGEMLEPIDWTLQLGMQVNLGG